MNMWFYELVDDIWVWFYELYYYDNVPIDTREVILLLISKDIEKTELINKLNTILETDEIGSSQTLFQTNSLQSEIIEDYLPKRRLIQLLNEFIILKDT